MKLNRMLVLTALAFFVAGLSRADVPPAQFTIDLGPGGWGGGQEFDATVNPADVDPTTFYGSPICTQSSDGNAYIASYGDECSVPEDASIQVNNAGDPDPATPTFVFFADASGGGVNDYYNPGPGPITSLLIKSTYTESSFFGDNFFECSSDIFSFCGFQVSGSTISIFLDEGSIPVAVPEPTYIAAFLTASGLLFWARKTRRSKRV